MLTLPAKARRKKQPYIYVRSRLSYRNLRKQAMVYFKELRQFAGLQGIAELGPSLIRYLSLGNDGVMELEFGCATARLYTGAGPIRSGILPSGTFISARWKGPFEYLFDVEAMINGWAERNGVDWAAVPSEDRVHYDCRLAVFHVTPLHVSDQAQFETEVAVMVRGMADSVSVPVQFGSGSAASRSHLPMANWRNE